MDEVLAALKPSPGQTLVDCTTGLGGHTSELLRRVLPTGRVIGIDFDTANIAVARERLDGVMESGTRKFGAISGGFDLFHNNFAALPTVLQLAGVEKVDGVLADIGVASTQIDDPERGFSYRKPGPLDMRMDATRGQPAWAVLERLSEQDIAQALLEYGDETDAPAIAKLIVEHRAHTPIRTTEDLTALVCQARDFTLHRAAGAKLHPAARTFQALRILTNREIANLDRLLRILPDVLRPGGRAAIISFHSGEDRRVKDALRDGLRAGTYSDISKDPLIATEAEQRANSRSKSAKLRWCVLAR